MIYIELTIYDYRTATLTIWPESIGNQGVYLSAREWAL